MNTKRKIKNVWVAIAAALFVFLLCFLISQNFLQLILVHGDSMEPTIHSGSFCFMDKRSKDYQYNDVVAFRWEGSKSLLVKRIYAMPGDKVLIRDGKFSVNGEEKAIMTGEYIESAGIASEEIVLGEDDYFLLGDNVNASKDSREKEIGLISREQIKGRLLLK